MLAVDPHRGMRRFRLTDHPLDATLVAEYGFDAFCGFFVEVVREGRDKPLALYDALQPGYDHQRPLLGALAFLVREKFFTTNQVDSALDAYSDREDESRLPKRAATALHVIENFKAAAD